MALLEFFIMSLGLTAVFVVGRMHRFPSAGTIFVFFFCLYVYVGAIVASTDLATANMLADTFARTIALIRLSFWTFVVIFVLSALVVRPARIEDLPPTQALDSYQMIALHVVGAVCAATSIIYVLVLPGNPWVAMLGDTSQVDFLREQATTKFKLFPLFSQWLNHITPFVFLVYWFAGRNRLALGLIGINTFALLATGQKAPLIYAIFLISLAIGLSKRQFPYARTTIAGVFGIAILIAIVVLQNFNVMLLGFDWNYVERAWEGIVRRVISVGTYVFYGYIDYFPLQMDHYFFDKPETPAENLVFKHMFPNIPIKGSANAAFVATMYAAFGGVSQLLFTIIVAVAGTLFVGERLCLRQSPTPFSLGLYVMICFAALKMCITSLPTVWISLFLFAGAARGIMLIVESSLRWLDTGVWGVRGNLYISLASLLCAAYLLQSWARLIL